MALLALYDFCIRYLINLLSIEGFLIDIPKMTYIEIFITIIYQLRVVVSSGRYYNSPVFPSLGCCFLLRPKLASLKHLIVTMRN